MQKKLHIKVGDTVQILSGEYRGKQGKVLVINRNKERATVEGLNMVKKHIKPSASNPQGGIVELEAAMHISNLMVVANGEASRIGRRLNDAGKLVRYSKKTGQEIK
jgi:large subunit ribosomal protein L24